jgi:hypothetical protein
MARDDAGAGSLCSWFVGLLNPSLFFVIGDASVWFPSISSKEEFRRRTFLT